MRPLCLCQGRRMLVMQVKVAWGLFYLTQQKIHLRNLKTLEKRGASWTVWASLLEFFPTLRSVTWESFLFGVGNASLYRFWKSLPKDAILPGTLLPASSLLNHLPLLQASVYPTGKRGTIPVLKSLFSTERSSTWITDPLGICQVFCAFYYLPKSDLSKHKQKNGQFNQATFTVVKLGWDNLHGKIRTSKCCCSSLKLTLTQTLFFF